MAENLKNTLLIEGTEYNINAVRSETAGTADKTQASLTLTKSLTTGDDKSQTFNGNVNQEIKYVPADLGGKFSGPVFIDNKYANLKDVPDQAIINYGQITSKIADLTGAPLYTLNDNYQIYSVTDANQIDYRLNTLVGTTQGLKALKSILVNPNGSAGIKYSYNTTSKSYIVEGPDPDAEYFDPNVVIPAIYKDPATNIEASVTTIANKAFYGNLNITSVVLPNSITSIGGINKDNNAPGIQVFDGCKNLVSINIPDGVQIISSSTFSGCAKLRNLKLGSGVTTIGSSAFSQCHSLESVIIPEKVINIEGFAFNGCENLTSVVIPKSVKTIGEQIFDVAASTPAVPLSIYYTGTKEEWEKLLADNAVFPSGSAAGQEMYNRRITGGNIGDTKIDPATITYEYTTGNTGNDNNDNNDAPDIPGDRINNIKAFGINPILYICKDPETEPIASPASNKMFLKLPGNTDFVEISKGAARLESQTEATTRDYYTYETLAAIIAGINSRLTALGSKALALPSALPETNDILIPNTIISEQIFVAPDVVPTVQELQEQLTKITGIERNFNEETGVVSYETVSVTDITPALKAIADDENVNIKTGYYRSANDKFTQDATGNKNINTISILDNIPTSGGNIGDICIVIPKV